MRIFAWAILVFSLVAFSAVAEGGQYTCPMHPHYITEEPGSCPICGMELVALEVEEEQKEDAPKLDSSKEQKILYWQAPMDPNFKSDKPGKSPMGMDLVPIYGDAETDETARVIVRIAPETIQNIGVRTEKAQITRFGTDVRSYGLVTENVRLKKEISSRVSGWVEELKITAVGDTVKRGDLLFTLYSPELVSAQQDYLAALSAGVKGRIASSEKRLSSLGVQQKFISQLKKKRKKTQNIPFYAETNGIVSHLMVNQGSYVKPGMQIAAVQNYATVWINVSVAEKDMQFLDQDNKASVVLPNLGDIVRTARIDYIYPTLDAASRTGQVRLVLDNVNGTLKPGAYADVTFETNIDKRLAIPSEAILRSSEGDFVVVALGKGRFQSQHVVTGVRTKGRTEIISGLDENDDIVVSSQFLIDSESSLKESFRKLKAAQKPLSELRVGVDQLVMIDHLVDTALYMHEVLTSDREFRADYVMPALKLNDHLIPKFRGSKLQFILENAEDAILEAKESITDQELRAALTKLMVALKPWLLEGKPTYYKNKGLNMFMDHPSGGLWLQKEGDTVNPYGEGHIMPQIWPDAQMPSNSMEG